MDIFNINLDSEEFSFKDGVIGGDDCILITPNNIKCKWTEDTLQFRSMIVRKSDNKIISRGYNKFFNWAEQPDINRFPSGPFEVMEKIDGSLIIWGIHNDELIHRTRGTFNLEAMDNGHELKFLMNKYPLLISAIKNNRDYSILTEWETKTNVIVISRVQSPTLTLVGAIHNATGKLLSQSELDSLAIAWNIERPNRYRYNSLMECIEDVITWNGLEGVVVYSEDGQNLRKLKSDWYCSLHAMATGIKSVKSVLDVFMDSPKFTKSEEFYNYISQNMDHEIAEKCKDYIKQICDAYAQVTLNQIGLYKWVNSYVKSLDSRKEQAQVIQKNCRNWEASTAFIYLDNREIDDKLLRKSIESYL